jgi:hypothetical protein
MKAKTLTLIALLAASSAIAQPVRNAAEKGTTQIQQRDEATVLRDRQELTQFQAYRKGMSDALAAGNVAMVQGHHAKLVNAMQNEVKQGQARINPAGNEVAATPTQARSESREGKRSRVEGKPVQAADGLTELSARNSRQQEILASFQAIQVQGNPEAIAALKAKVNLLDEFEQSMVRDLGESRE